MRIWATLGEPLAWGLVAVIGALFLAAASAGDSSTVGVGIVGLLAIGVWLAWGRQPRRLLIAGLFFLAPVDVSKAIVAPIDRFYSPGLYLSAAHVVLILLTVLWLGRRLIVERRALPFTRLDLLAFAWIAWISIRTIGSLQGTLATASAVTYGLAVLGFYVASHALETPEDMRLALRAAVYGLIAEALWVGAQLATHTPLALPGAKVSDAAGAGDMLFFGGAGEAFRPSGFFAHPNSLADHMTLLIPPAFALVLLGLRKLEARVWWTAAGVVVVASALLLVTLSRGGWAAAVLGGAWVVYRYVRHGLLTPRHLAQMAVAVGIGAVALVVVYPDIILRLTAPDERSTESRIILADQAVTIIKVHPWIGVGYGGYNRAAYEYIAPAFANISEEYQEALLQLVVHNHYLLIAAELGLPAMVFFGYLVMRLVLLPKPWQSWHDPTSFALATGLSGSLVTQVLFLASDNFYADVRLFMIWLTAGALQALCLQQRELERLQARERANEPLTLHADGERHVKPGSLSHALGSAMGARVGMAVLNYGLFWILSHWLPTSTLGGYSLLMNVFYMSALMPLLGLSTALTRRAATERANVGVELSNAVVFAAPVSVLLCAVVACVGLFAYGPELRVPFLLLALAMLPTGAVLVSESTLMGLERVADIARFQFAEAASRTAFCVLAVWLGYGLIGVFSVFLVLRVGMVVAYRLHPMLPRFDVLLVSRAVQRRSWNEVPVFLGICLLASVAGRVDIIVLSRMSGLREVGIYAAAARLYEASLMLPTIAALAIMPTLARLFASDREYFRKVLVLAMRLSLGAGFVVALGVAALADPIIHLLYRPQVSDAASVLRWLIFGAVLMTLDQILSSTMMAARAQSHDLRALVVGLGTLVVGLVLLVPRCGATGAAMAVALTICMRVLYRVRWVVKLLELHHVVGDLGRVVLAVTLGIAALVFALPYGAPAAFGASLGLYVAVLFATGAVRPGMLAGARALFGR